MDEYHCEKPTCNRKHMPPCIDCVRDIRADERNRLVEPIAKALYRENTFGEIDTTRWEDLQEEDKSYDFKDRRQEILA
jgi:hypothetical protein